MDVDTGKKVRLTHAPGADVLPVFSPDGKKLMWTSTRDGRLAVAAVHRGLHAAERVEPTGQQQASRGQSSG